MRHAARQLPSWLIYDVGQEFTGMITQMLLLMFGWRRTPEHFASKYASYINARLSDHGSMHSDKLSEACSISLSHLAYTRARKERDDRPLLIHFVRELNKVSDAVEAALSGYEVDDREVRGVLTWHGIDRGGERAEAQRLAGIRKLQAEEERELSWRAADGPSFKRVVGILVVGFAILAAVASVISVVRR